MIIYLTLWCLLATLSHGERWVWSGNNRRSDDGRPRVYTGVAAALVPPSQALFKPTSSSEDFAFAQSSKVRYQVGEPGENGDFGDYQQNRPPINPAQQYNPSISNSNRPVLSYKPNNNYDRPNNRPGGGFGLPSNEGYRPSGNGGYRPPSGERPILSGPNRPSNRPQEGGRPILTGPIPSWERGDDRYKEYDRCKCVHSFNCNTPGIQFGSCDADKKYCCYRDESSLGPVGVREQERPRPILAGPGGPVDRPYNQRPRPVGNLGSRPLTSSYKPYDRFDNYDREDRREKYPTNNKHSSDLEEAYRRGLESAIQETFSRPSGGSFGGRDHVLGQKNGNSKYGLYQPQYGLYSRSANSSISAEP